MMFVLDLDDAHADWPKRTPDRRADLTPADDSGAQYDLRHLPGRHDQSTHGRKSGWSGMIDRVRTEEGLTVDMAHGGSSPTSGHVVSRRSQDEYAPGVTNGIVVSESTFFGRGGARRLASYVRARAGAFDDDGAMLGVWHDTEHGEVALDLVDVVADRAAAVALGRANDQQAIYDIAAGEVIDTGGSGGREDLAGRAAEAGVGHDRRRAGGVGRPGDRPGWQYDLLDLRREYVREPAGSSKGGQFASTKGVGGMVAGDESGSHDDVISTGTEGHYTAAKVRHTVKPPAGDYDATAYENLQPEERSRLEDNVKRVNPTYADQLGDDPIGSMSDNITAVFGRASADNVERDALWYSDAHDTGDQIIAGTGYPSRVGSALIASQSPQAEWEMNVETARYTMQLHRENPDLAAIAGRTAVVGGAERSVRAQIDAEYERLSGGKKLPDDLSGVRLRDLDPDAQAVIIKNLSQSGYRAGPDGQDSDGPLRYIRGDGTSAIVSWSTGLGSVSKSVQILESDHSVEAISDILGGHKVRSFYDNIVERGLSSTQVTIDTHAGNIAFNGISIPDKPVKASLGTGLPRPTEDGQFPNGDWVNTGYPVFAEAYRRATAAINTERAARGLSPLTPSQVQAITWTQWRREHPKGFPDKTRRRAA